MKISPIDPVSGTAIVSDDRGAGVFSFYILETRGPEIAVLGVTIERSTGEVGTYSAVMTQTGVCKLVATGSV